MIVLDTHTLVWWREENRNLSRRAKQAIESADRIVVPTICCFELTTLERRGRMTLDRGVTAWVRSLLSAPRVEELALSSEIAAEAGRLPDGFPGDPVDRIVYATATWLGSRLVTRDRHITAFDRARVIW